MINGYRNLLDIYNQQNHSLVTTIKQIVERFRGSGWLKNQRTEKLIPSSCSQENIHLIYECVVEEHKISIIHRS